MEGTNIKYKSRGKKNPTPEEVLHDIRAIARRHGVYLKEADPATEYFWDKITQVKRLNYYYGMRLEVLGFRHARAVRNFKQNAHLKIA
jgi:hypothetical protein